MRTSLLADQPSRTPRTRNSKRMSYFKRLMVLGLTLVAGWVGNGVLVTQLWSGEDDSTAQQASAPQASWKRILRGEWADYQGRVWTSEEFSQSEVVVYAFLGTECPLAQLYASKLVEIEKRYQDKKVSFIAVNPNVQDSLQEMAAQAKRQKIEFPYVKDPDQSWADQLGVTRTPEVCVVDRQNRLVYRGRIDDQYGIGFQRETPTNNDLVDAIDGVLAGETISYKHTDAPGCLIGRNSPTNQPEANGVAGTDLPTYSGQVSQILLKRCVECHRDGEIGPMNFTEYDDVVAWADMIMEVVQERRMPPWHASPAHGEFKNDRRMTQREIDTLQKWTDTGKLRGDPELDATIPPRETDWQIEGTPDMVIPMADEPYQVAARGDVAYQYFVVDPKHTDDLWIRGLEVAPGNRAIVHHILVFLRDKGTGEISGLGGEKGFLAGYVPGTRAEAFPHGYAKRIPKNQVLFFQVHYTPNGTPQTDLSKVAFWLADPQSITHEIHTTSAMQTRLSIPPFEANYRSQATVKGGIPESQLLAMSPHMHLRGKAFKYTAVFPDGTKQVLLDIPHYDFNWQTEYRLANPLKFPAGSNIRCEAVYDNSEGNLNNPDPSKTVHWGDQTYEEMMIGYFHIATKATHHKD